MKYHIIYECKTCGKKSENKEDILECEAAHLGLTIAEKKTYDFLKDRVKNASSVVSRTKNDDTDKAFDKAVNELVDFEKEFGINGWINSFIGVFNIN